MKDIKVLRAEEEWQRAGAYSVRIQGMNRQHHISLRDEFDDYDGEKCKYIVLLDDEYPVATCRFYELDERSVLVGRVVVLPEYRGQHLGRKVIAQAEKWIEELGYKEIRIDSRVEAVGFYKKLGYSLMDDEVIKSWNFSCKRMCKSLAE
ncbi:MAG: GNAT family N-acetyltransferase [Ruminococcus sp.]|nr:GNAT family N-acetyltransferase [Ruminococcus sp.]